MKYLNYFQINSKVILAYFFISFLLLVLNNLTNKKINKWFSSGRDSILNIMTYIRMITHIFIHSNYNHFRNNLENWNKQ